MAQLYPPIINSVLPPMIMQVMERDGLNSLYASFTIPFKLDPSVNPEEIDSFILRVKTFKNENVITSFVFTATQERIDSNKIISNYSCVKYPSIKPQLFEDGEYYKATLLCRKKGTESASSRNGYESNTAIIKCIHTSDYKALKNNLTAFDTYIKQFLPNDKYVDTVAKNLKMYGLKLKENEDYTAKKFESVKYNLGTNTKKSNLNYCNNKLLIRYGTSDSSEQIASYQIIIRHNTRTDNGKLKSEIYYQEENTTLTDQTKVINSIENNMSYSDIVFNVPIYLLRAGYLSEGTRHYDVNEFTIQTIVTTLGGAIIKTPEYNISNSPTFDFGSFGLSSANAQSLIDGVPTTVWYTTVENGREVTKSKKVTLGPSLEILSNRDKGCFEIYLKNFLFKNPFPIKSLTQIKFALLRYDNVSNYWFMFKRFTLNKNTQSKRRLLFRDYNISQGVTYQYRLFMYFDPRFYQFTQGGSMELAGYSFSRAIEPDNTTIAYFNDMFLIDKNKSLKVLYNPKVSSYKVTILESKLDTIGGKYPIFNRNGNTHYKEMQLSGLISVTMDEFKLFRNGIDPNVTDNSDMFRRKSTNTLTQINVDENPLTMHDQNVESERLFRDMVVEWLNNGKPKIFKSPTEGNMIVRLLNITLTPMDQLGRMLYTFQCQAYEIADYTTANLIKYDLIGA